MININKNMEKIFIGSNKNEIKNIEKILFEVFSNVKISNKTSNHLQCIVSSLREDFDKYCFSLIVDAIFLNDLYFIIIKIPLPLSEFKDKIDNFYSRLLDLNSKHQGVYSSINEEENDLFINSSLSYKKNADLKTFFIMSAKNFNNYVDDLEEKEKEKLLFII